MSQQIIVKPLGIITQPNKLGSIPAGALSKADNAYMRSPGTIESAKAWSTLSTVPGGSAVDRVYTTAVGQFILAVYRSGGSWNYGWYPAAGGAATYSGSLSDEFSESPDIDDSGRFSFLTYRSRTFLLGIYGMLVWDYESPTSSAEASPRRPGHVQPTYISSTTLTTGQPGALEDGRYCHATAIFRRKYADGYELVSAPCASIMIYAYPGGGKVNIQFFVTYSASAKPKAGDICEIYRTRSQPYLSVNTGSDFLRSTSYVLTTADVATNFFSVIDTVPDGGLSESLYTNSGVKGASSAAFPPHGAKCMASFRGHAFYANTIDQAVVSFRVPVSWLFYGNGNQVPAYYRANGIGQRLVRGDSTLGNATLINVPAVDIVGIKIGQVSGSSVYSGGVVTAVGASSVTFNVTAASTLVATSVAVVDAIEFGENASTITVKADSIDSVASYVAVGFFDVAHMSNIDRVIPQPDAVVSGVFANTAPSDKFSISILYRQKTTPISLSIRATNGDNFDPKLPRIELAEAARTFSPTSRLSGIYWSEKEQPENCPPLNIDNVGKGEIYACVSTRDALWFFCSDGLWRLSGTGGAAGQGFDWRIDPVDSTLVIAGPQAACALRDMVYAYTNRGLVSITSAGTVTELSKGRIEDVLPDKTWSAPSFTSTNSVFLVADLDNDEVVLKESTATGNRIWLYNIHTDAFTQMATSAPANHGCYSAAAGAVVLAIVDGTGGSLVQPSASAYASMDLKFQPVYGDNPFEQHHWRKIEPAFNTAGSATCVASVNSFGSIGSRALTDSGEPVYARTGFTVPRNAPAVSNNIAVGLTVTSTALVKLQGISIDYAAVTDQRRGR